jgi:hypothetical protein
MSYVLWHRLKNWFIFRDGKFYSAAGHWANRSCRHFIITFFPLTRHGVRLSTAFLYDPRGALAKES